MKPTTCRLAGFAVAALLIVTSIGAPMRGRAAVAAPTIQEWALANAPGQYEPHDPAADPDGSVWYTGFGVNVVGRLEPKMGQVREFTLPTAATGPHGITLDKQGMVWYTGNRASLIGKLDPKTGNVVEYKMPDPAARDPHSPVFDANGILWFTVQMGNFIGKLDPATGVVTVKAVATPKSNPHGIVIDSKGIPVFALSASNKIGTVDPKTMEITEHVLPEGARPKRVAVSADDAIWYTDTARGFLGRLDRKTDQVKEFATPGGPKAGPWSIAITKDGIIWYTESEAPTNAIVRFDPKTEAIQAWPLPTKGGVVRHMVATPEGFLWLACSGIAKMVRVLPAS
jgi:virginiamycin B lyase